MNKRKIELFKFKIDTLRRYNGIYQDYLREAVLENERLNEELWGIEDAAKAYMDAYKIDGSGFTDGKSETPFNIRMDVVYRCVRLMRCIYDKAPAKCSKYVSKSNGCAIGSYGLKHILEYWIGLLSGNTVAKPCESANASYVSNGEAILACLVLRDEFVDWTISPNPMITFNINKRHGGTPNLECIRFNAKFSKFLSKEFDFFTEKNFEFGYDVDGNLLAISKFDESSFNFNERRFNEGIWHPSNIWGDKLALAHIERGAKCR